MVPRPFPTQTPPIPDTWYTRNGKRVFDLVLTSLLLIITAPLIALAWLILRLSVGRGVILRQSRIGLGGRQFTMYKLRTMQRDRRHDRATFEGDDRRVGHKSDDDPRHTPAGRVLRKLSIDELPQLINVVRGEMSLVGPRPELAEIIAEHDLAGHPRHLLRPGVTGPWQVNVRPTGALLHETLDEDLWYLPRISLGTDLSLLARTALVVTSGR